MFRSSKPALTFAALSLSSLIGGLLWMGMRSAPTPQLEFRPGNALAKVETAVPSGLPEVVGVNAHIRPILSDKCFSCHGFDSTTRKENLRLDTEEGAFAALESDASKRAIVPGKPEDSVVWQRVQTVDPDEIMPPPDFHKPLSDEEKQLIQKWIEQGAKYQEHWAFAPLSKPTVQEIGTQHPIDSMIRSGLRQHGLQTSPPADKATLLRRLSLDLIGLPPTPEEVQTFLSEN
jgi:hypothetical protein